MNSEDPVNLSTGNFIYEHEDLKVAGEIPVSYTHLDVYKRQVTFSVNRFGSVYVFDQTLKDIEGTYIQNEIDVKLKEVKMCIRDRTYIVLA